MGINKAITKLKEMSESELVQIVAENYRENRIYTVGYSLAITVLGDDYFDFPENCNNKEAIKIILDKWPEYFI